MISKTMQLLADRIQLNRRALWDWHMSYAKKAPPPFYCSIDLRDSGHKIVPVDSNLFPAGFNNICPDDLRAAPAVVRAQVEAMASRAGLETPKKILIIPEAHTSNGYYLENLHYLSQILKNADFELRLGWYGGLPEGSSSPLKLLSVTSKQLEAYPLEVREGVA